MKNIINILKSIRRVSLLEFSLGPSPISPYGICILKVQVATLCKVWISETRCLLSFNYRFSGDVTGPSFNILFFSVTKFQTNHYEIKRAKEQERYNYLDSIGSSRTKEEDDEYYDLSESLY